MTAAPRLSIAPSSLDEPPYPADTRAKGWRFELDYERIEQSDTWALAPADMRPWLLMLWLTAWRQTPCGSLPADDALIAARIGMDPRQFKAHRDILMRGWRLASDGRLYHQTITTSVMSMLESRLRERGWKRGQRLKNQALSDECPPGLRLSPVGVVAPVPVPVPEEEKYTPKPPAPQRSARARSAGAEPDGFPEFWSAYPRKAAKQAAVKAFARLAPSRELLDTLLSAVRSQSTSPDWRKDDGQFIPHAATWLNGRRWEDARTTCQQDLIGYH